MLAAGKPKTIVISLITAVLFLKCSDIRLVAYEEAAYSVALTPYRYEIRLDASRSVLKRCFINIKVYADEIMLRNMLLTKYEFNLKTL